MNYDLKSPAPKIPHILEDTRDFFCRINEIDNIPDDTILGSFDVVGLYPNIPHEEGIETMHEYSEIHSDKLVSTNSLCDLGSIILRMRVKVPSKKRYCYWNQVCSSIFMAVFEKGILQNSVFKSFLWFRYLDDNFYIWTQVSQNLNKFFKYINNLHPTIKFTMDYSTKGINFLDVTVTKVGNKLETDLYRKLTDMHQYL